MNATADGAEWSRPTRAMVIERAPALGAAGDAVIVTDAVGSIIYWNDAAARWNVNVSDVPVRSAVGELVAVIGVSRQTGR